ncbi:MAG: hypothetical protein ABJE95_37365 [Byssovorax sp.]
MAAKQVTDREKSATAVAAAGHAHAEAAGVEVGKLLKPHLVKGESLPDVGLVMILVARALEAAKTRMVEADATHEAELGDDDGFRSARDEATAALSDKLVELREVIVGMYGSATANAVFPGPAPQDPVVLSRFAGEVAAQIERVKLPASRIKGAKLDPAETASDLRDLRAALDGKIKDVAREVREAQATLDAKNRALGSYDELFGGGATALTGLLRMAGKADLAAKVKPSTRRPGQTASDAGDPAAAPAGPVEK